MQTPLQWAFEMQWAAGLTVTTTGLNKHDKDTIRREIESSGGRYSPNLSKRTTHLITPDVVELVTEKLAAAAGAGQQRYKALQVVSQCWVSASTTSRQKAEESKYTPSLPAHQACLTAPAVEMPCSIHCHTSLHGSSATHVNGSATTASHNYHARLEMETLYNTSRPPPLLQAGADGISAQQAANQPSGGTQTPWIVHFSQLPDKGIYTADEQHADLPAQPHQLCLWASPIPEDRTQEHVTPSPGAHADSTVQHSPGMLAARYHHIAQASTGAAGTAAHVWPPSAASAVPGNNKDSATRVHLYVAAAADSSSKQQAHVTPRHQLLDAQQRSLQTCTMQDTHTLQHRVSNSVDPSDRTAAAAAAKTAHAAMGGSNSDIQVAASPMSPTQTSALQLLLKQMAESDSSANGKPAGHFGTESTAAVPLLVPTSEPASCSPNRQQPMTAGAGMPVYSSGLETPPDARHRQQHSAHWLPQQQVTPQQHNRLQQQQQQAQQDAHARVEAQGTAAGGGVGSSSSSSSSSSGVDALISALQQVHWGSSKCSIAETSGSGKPAAFQEARATTNCFSAGASMYGASVLAASVSGASIPGAVGSNSMPSRHAVPAPGQEHRPWTSTGGQVASAGAAAAARQWTLSAADAAAVADASTTNSINSLLLSIARLPRQPEADDTLSLQTGTTVAAAAGESLSAAGADASHDAKTQLCLAPETQCAKQQLSATCSEFGKAFQQPLQQQPRYWGSNGGNSTNDAMTASNMVASSGAAVAAAAAATRIPVGGAEPVQVDQQMDLQQLLDSLRRATGDSRRNTAEVVAAAAAVPAPPSSSDGATGTRRGWQAPGSIPQGVLEAAAVPLPMSQEAVGPAALQQQLASYQALAEQARGISPSAVYNSPMENACAAETSRQLHITGAAGQKAQQHTLPGPADSSTTSTSSVADILAALRRVTGDSRRNTAESRRNTAEAVSHAAALAISDVDVRMETTDAAVSEARDSGKHHKLRSDMGSRDVLVDRCSTRVGKAQARHDCSRNTRTTALDLRFQCADSSAVSSPVRGPVEALGPGAAESAGPAPPESPGPGPASIDGLISALQCIAAASKLNGDASLPPVVTPMTTHTQVAEPLEGVAGVKGEEYAQLVEQLSRELSELNQQSLNSMAEQQQEQQHQQQDVFHAGQAQASAGNLWLPTNHSNGITPGNHMDASPSPTLPTTRSPPPTATAAVMVAKPTDTLFEATWQTSMQQQQVQQQQQPAWQTSMQQQQLLGPCSVKAGAGADCVDGKSSSLADLLAALQASTHRYAAALAPPGQQQQAQALCLNDPQSDMQQTHCAPQEEASSISQLCAALQRVSRPGSACMSDIRGTPLPSAGRGPQPGLQSLHKLPCVEDNLSLAHDTAESGQGPQVHRSPALVPAPPSCSAAVCSQPAADGEASVEVATPAQLLNTGGAEAQPSDAAVMQVQRLNMGGAEAQPSDAAPVQEQQLNMCGAEAHQSDAALTSRQQSHVNGADAHQSDAALTPRQQLGGCAAQIQETLKAPIQAHSDAPLNLANMVVVFDRRVADTTKQQLAEALVAAGGSVLPGSPHLSCKANTVVADAGTAAEWLHLLLDIVTPTWLAKTLAQQQQQEEESHNMPVAAKAASLGAGSAGIGPRMLRLSPDAAKGICMRLQQGSQAAAVPSEAVGHSGWGQGQGRTSRSCPSYSSCAPHGTACTPRIAAVAASAHMDAGHHPDGCQVVTKQTAEQQQAEQQQQQIPVLEMPQGCQDIPLDCSRAPYVQSVLQQQQAVMQPAVLLTDLLWCVGQHPGVVADEELEAVILPDCPGATVTLLMAHGSSSLLGHAAVTCRASDASKGLTCRDVLLAIHDFYQQDVMLQAGGATLPRPSPAVIAGLHHNQQNGGGDCAVQLKEHNARQLSQLREAAGSGDTHGVGEGATAAHTCGAWPVKRLQLLGHKRMFEGLFRASRDPCSTVYEVCLA